MKAYTWAPGTNPELDSLFEKLREDRYNDKSHRYWKNYDKDSFQFAVALTICFNENNDPEIMASIASRDCWPNKAYRILNRSWKQANKKNMLPRISDTMGYATISQIDWLKENTDCELYFISRQTDNWQEWVKNNFKKHFNLDFETAPYKYLTCPNECDDTCWQSIIYSGNAKLLKKWKHR